MNATRLKNLTEFVSTLLTRIPSQPAEGDTIKKWMSDIKGLHAGLTSNGIIDNNLRELLEPPDLGQMISILNYLQRCGSIWEGESNKIRIVLSNLANILNRAIARATDTNTNQDSHINVSHSPGTVLNFGRVGQNILTGTSAGRDVIVSSTIGAPIEWDKIRAELTALIKELQELKLPEETKNEIEAELQTCLAQSRKREPNQELVRGQLQEAGRILEAGKVLGIFDAAGGTLQFIQAIGNVLAMLG